MINHIKLDYLQSKLAEGERDLIEGRHTELKQEELSDHFKIIKNVPLTVSNKTNKLHIICTIQSCTWVFENTVAMDSGNPVKPLIQDGKSLQNVNNTINTMTIFLPVCL